jgi:hypothetical protein
LTCRGKEKKKDFKREKGGDDAKWMGEEEGDESRGEN